MIDNHLFEGKSFREIGRLLGRSPSTTLREVAKNGDSLHYSPEFAHKAAVNRRHTQERSKIGSNPKLKAYILEKLALWWAPEAIAGRWNKENRH